MSTIHVMPVNDLREHVANDDCWCEPVQEYVVEESGSSHWLASHNALDGRE
jgi:hypothetical protein